jgi:hypothetical protein
MGAKRNDAGGPRGGGVEAASSAEDSRVAG